jgi:glycosyltransferase involved in cell wall biosynthesis
MDLSEMVPKVSVCVITYNHEKYIRKCLQSLIDQTTDFYFEVIVGEDCSTDGTRAIIKEFVDNYPQIFKSILHDKNVGGCDNYRAVHFASRGQFIAHIDGDDYWHTEKLQSQIDFMESHPNCAAVYTNAWVESDSGETLGTFSSGVKTFFDLPYLIEMRNYLTSSSTLYRSEFRKLAIPTSGEFVDFHIHIRLAQLGQLGFIDKNLVTYTHRSATSILASDNKKVRGLIWNSLCEINKSGAEIFDVDRAKVVFIIESILLEFKNINYQGLINWASLLPNILAKYTPSLKVKLLYLTAANIQRKLLNKFLLRLSSNSRGRVFYKR